MFEINGKNPEYAIAEIVERMLPRHSGADKVLVLALIASVGLKHKGMDGTHRIKNFLLMFHRPMNYTKVLWLMDHTAAPVGQSLVWQLRSDHDSCWRADGIGAPLWELGMQMRRGFDTNIKLDDFAFELAVNDKVTAVHPVELLQEINSTHYRAVIS